MAEKPDLSPILPDAPDEHDACMGRLRTAASGRRQDRQSLSSREPTHHGIPISGGVHHSRSAKMIAAVTVSRQEVQLTQQRQLETESASAVVTARGTYDSLQIANEGVAAMQENAGLVQRRTAGVAAGASPGEQCAASASHSPESLLRAARRWIHL